MHQHIQKRQGLLEFYKSILAITKLILGPFVGGSASGGYTVPAPVFVGVNTADLSASITPTPDLISIAATPVDPGIVNLPINGDWAFFSTAAINIGANSDILIEVDDGGAGLPVDFAICESDINLGGACKSPPGAAFTFSITNDETKTFAVFVRTNGQVAFLPQSNRAFLRFTDEGRLVGSTSIALRSIN